MATKVIRGFKNTPSGQAGLNDAYFSDVSEAMIFRSGAVVGNMTPAMLVKAVPWLARCVSLRAILATRVPLALMSGAKFDQDVTDDPAYASIMDSFRENLMMLIRGLMIGGAGYLVPQAGNVRGADITFKYIRKKFMKPRLVRGELVGFDFQGRQEDPPEFYPVDEVIYFWNPNDESDTEPGPAECQAALTDASVLWALGAMQAGYFNNGGTPTFLVEIPAGQSPADKADFQNLMNRRVGGVWNAFKNILVRANAGVKATKMGADMKDMQAPEIETSKRQGVAVALGISPPVVDMEHANKATAGTTMLALFTLTIIPHLDWLFGIFNKQFLKQYGLKLVTQPDQLEEVQSAQLLQATAIAILTGRPVLGINEGRALAGYDELTPDEIDELLPSKSAPQPPTPLTEPNATTAATEVPADAVARPDVQAKAVAGEQFELMTRQYAALRKAALDNPGMPIGSAFDAELVKCQTKTQTRAVFDRHWPHSAQAEPSLAEIGERLAATIERVASMLKESQ